MASQADLKRAVQATRMDRPGANSETPEQRAERLKSTREQAEELKGRVAREQDEAYVRWLLDCEKAGVFGDAKTRKRK